MSLLDYWRRVSREHPCPICERPGWCLLSADGSAAKGIKDSRERLRFCYTSASDRPMTLAGWLPARTITNWLVICWPSRWRDC